MIQFRTLILKLFNWFPEAESLFAIQNFHFSSLVSIFTPFLPNTWIYSAESCIDQHRGICLHIGTVIYSPPRLTRAKQFFPACSVSLIYSGSSSNLFAFRRKIFYWNIAALSDLKTLSTTFWRTVKDGQWRRLGYYFYLIKTHGKEKFFYVHYSRRKQFPLYLHHLILGML